MANADWSGAGPDALSWLEGIASDDDAAGFNVGPMPDKAFVLHPLAERVDGRPLAWTTEGQDHERPSVPADDAALHRLTWQEYARRRDIPMFEPPGYASGRDALPGVLDDDFVDVPSEGFIEDDTTRQALFDVLLRHTAGLDPRCTAYYYDFYVGGPCDESVREQTPNILRGPLPSWRDLFDRPKYVLSPQNLWPDDHSWVLTTHVDSWATEISGSRELIEDLIAAPDLEVLRLPHLD